MKMNKTALLSVLCMLFGFYAFSESEGEKAFKMNNPALAAELLRQEIELKTASKIAYNYLGLAYYQLGQYEKSVEAFRLGLETQGTNKKIIAFNQGNAYYAMNDYANAAKSYTLTITADPKYTQALLNRANAYLMLADYDKCIEDYERFLILEPYDPQRPQIEELLALLRKEKVRIEEEKRIAEEEAARIAEEEARMQEELARQKAEEERLEAERRAAEAERRRKLLEDVANSLQDTDSTNMSAGSGDLLDFDYESELD